MLYWKDDWEKLNYKYISVFLKIVNSYNLFDLVLGSNPCYIILELHSFGKLGGVFSCSVKNWHSIVLYLLTMAILNDESIVLAAVCPCFEGASKWDTSVAQYIV